MKINELLDLPVPLLLKFMRDGGIRSLQVDGRSIVLGPPARHKVEEPSAFKDEEIKQRCGHALWEANESGECLWGCEPVAEDK